MRGCVRTTLGTVVLATSVVEARGRILVGGDEAIRRLAPTDPATLLRVWGDPGSGDGRFDNIADLAVDAQRNVYVGDRGNQRVRVFVCPD